MPRNFLPGHDSGRRYKSQTGNILIISSIFPPHVFGGAEIAAYERAKLLVRRGFSVSVVTLQEKDDSPAWGDRTPEGYRLYRIKTPRSHTLLGRSQKMSLPKKIIWHFQDYFDRRNRFLINAVLDDSRPDHIEIDNIIGFGFNILSEISRRNISVSYILHDLNLACFNTGMIRKGKVCEKQCFSCRGIAAIRQKDLKKISCLGFISPTYTHLQRAKRFIPAVNGAPSCVIRNVPEEMPRLRDRKTSNQVRLLFAGRLDPVKGIDFLLHALDPLKGNFDFSLTVLGTGPIEKIIRAQYELETWVSFRGFVSRAEIDRMLAQSDLYCIPSFVPESYGLVTARALQMGVPVIGSKIGGTAELVRDGITGILLPPGNENAWRQAFAHIFSNRQILRDWRRNAISHAHEFDENVIGQAHEKFIKQLSSRAA